MQRIKQEAEIYLDKEEIANLFEKEFEGWCPVCKNACINQGESICCDCFTKALTYHTNTCGCYP